MSLSTEDLETLTDLVEEVLRAEDGCCCGLGNDVP
jgi:hypothetical protein